MADIDVLMGLGLERPDQAQALADQLRGRKQAADLFSMSTIGPVAQAATNEREAILGAAQRGGALIRARKKLEDARKAAETPNIGKYNPGDYTDESWAEYYRGGLADPTVLERRGNFEVGGIRYDERGNPIVAADTVVDTTADIAGAEQTAKDFASNVEKFKAGESKVLTRIESSRAKQDTLNEVIEDAIPLLDEWTTGYGGLLANLPDTEARRLDKLLDTVRANVAFGALTEMRENSPTGGALGNVSNIELSLLGSTLGSLDNLNSAEDLAKSLRRIQRVNEGAIERAQSAYEMDRKRYYGEEDPDEEESEDVPTSFSWDDLK